MLESGAVGMVLKKGQKNVLLALIIYKLKTAIILILDGSYASIYASIGAHVHIRFRSP
jgi:hypothetical protein